MLKISGRLSTKSILKKGVSAKGEWQIIEFTITKQFNHEKFQVAFVALGKMADVVNAFPLNKKLTIRFIPKCKFYNGKWYTELKAFEIEEWKKPVPYVTKEKENTSETSVETPSVMELRAGKYNQGKMMDELGFQKRDNKNKNPETSPKKKQDQSKENSPPKEQNEIEFNFNPSKEATENDESTENKTT